MTKKSVALQKRSGTNLQNIKKDIWQSESSSRRLTAKRTITPPVDVIENENEIVLIADMPGIEKDDLNVAVEKDMLSIGGHRDVPHPHNFNWEDPDPEYERISYYREFRLGDDIQKERIDASYRDGVLRIALPKTEDAKPKWIKVKGE